MSLNCDRLDSLIQLSTCTGVAMGACSISTCTGVAMGACSISTCTGVGMWACSISTCTDVAMGACSIQAEYDGHLHQSALTMNVNKAS